MPYKSDAQRKAVYAKLNPRFLTLDAQKYIDNNYNKIYKLTGKKKGCFTPDTGFIKPKFDKNGNLVKVEAVCGASTSALEDLLGKQFGKKNIGNAEQGHFIGHGKENSEGYNQFENVVEHEWLRLPDGTIVDGARGQFIKDNLKRNDLSKKDRMKLIHPMSPEQGAYYNRKLCKGCGSMLSHGEYDCPTCKIIKSKNKINGD
jgi:hypothetical protein